MIFFFFYEKKSRLGGLEREREREGKQEAGKERETGERKKN